MKRPDYIDRYLFNWESFEIITGGKSSIDGKGGYLSGIKDKEEIDRFISGYGFDAQNPIQQAELFGHFQEAMQFIKRYFLIEGNDEFGIDLTVPNVFYTITDFADLFLIANRKKKRSVSTEDSLWASIILKLMHVILHADKDLRYNYFKTVQTQILDRFYKFIHRDEEDRLFLCKKLSDPNKIELTDYNIKSQKNRDSIILKLLHKRESVAEDLFDRIGVRFVTKTKLDSLLLIKFLHENYIVMVNNVKPSRSMNSLVDLNKFKENYSKVLKKAYRENLSEKDFVNLLNKCIDERPEDFEKVNSHSSDSYSAIHFTLRQLIRYRNPFFKEFLKLKKVAREEDSELARKLLSLDTSSVAKDIQFFYPFEVQITDSKNYFEIQEGDANHSDYKKSQIQTAIKRLFVDLIEYKNIKLQF